MLRGRLGPEEGGEEVAKGKRACIKPTGMPLTLRLVAVRWIGGGVFFLVLLPLHRVTPLAASSLKISP